MCNIFGGKVDIIDSAGVNGTTTNQPIPSSTRLIKNENSTETKLMASTMTTKIIKMSSTMMTTTTSPKPAVQGKIMSKTVAGGRNAEKVFLGK